MRILVIGGTGFISLPLVYSLVEEGHEVVVYNRGNHDQLLPAMVSKVTGDRHNAALLKHTLHSDSYDVLVDMCGYTPDDLRPLIDAGLDHIPHVVFCSTSSVYNFGGETNLTELHHPLRAYGYGKHLCEQYLRQHLHQALSVIRPSYVYGVRDPARRMQKTAALVNACDVVTLPEALRDSETMFIAVSDLVMAMHDIILDRLPITRDWDLAYPHWERFTGLTMHWAKLLNRQITITYGNPESPFPYDLPAAPLFDPINSWKRLGKWPSVFLAEGLRQILKSMDMSPAGKKESDG